MNKYESTHRTDLTFASSLHIFVAFTSECTHRCAIRRLIAHSLPTRVLSTSLSSSRTVASLPGSSFVHSFISTSDGIERTFDELSTIALDELTFSNSDACNISQCAYVYQNHTAASFFNEAIALKHATRRTSLVRELACSKFNETSVLN